MQKEVLDCLAGVVHSEIVELKKKKKKFSVSWQMRQRMFQNHNTFHLYSGTIKMSHQQDFSQLMCWDPTASHLSHAVGKIVHLLEHHGFDYKNNRIG